MLNIKKKNNNNQKIAMFGTAAGNDAGTSQLQQ